MKYIMPPMQVFEDEFWSGLRHELTDKRIFDRTHTLDLPYEQVDISPIPEYKHTNDSLTTVSLAVADDILRHNNNIHVMWSGGIDSTNIVTSFLASGCRPTIVHSEESISEFPEFYRDVVVGLKLDTIVFTNFRDILKELSEQEHVTIVGGEHGDYCTREVGIANKKGWVNGTGFTWKVEEGIPPARRDFLQPVLRSAPFDLEDIDDEFWWLFWTMKWQLNAYRWHHIVRKKITNLIHFYDHDLIQNWSMSNPARKHNKDIHKYPLKESIFSYYNADKVWFLRKIESTPKVMFGWNGMSMAEIHAKGSAQGIPNYGGPYNAWIDEDWNFGGYTVNPNDTIHRLIGD